MQMTKKQIAEKALAEPDFLVAILDNVEKALKCYNIEAANNDVEEVKVSMRLCQEFILGKLSELKGSLDGEPMAEAQWGIGVGCC